MNVLNKVTLNNLKLNKKRTIGTIIGIILSVALICAVAGMFASLRKTFITTEIMDSGYYHVEISDLKDEEINVLKNNRSVKYLNQAKEIGLTELDNNYFRVYSIDDTNVYKNMSIFLVKGNYPKNENEIVINRNYAKNEIGDIISLDIGEEGEYEESSIKILNPIKKEFRVVGIVDSYSYIDYSYPTLFTANMNSDNNYAFISLKNPMKYKSEIPKVLGVDSYKKIDNSKYEFTLNENLLRWEAFKFSDSTIKVFINLFLIVVGIVMFTSIYCIRNAFAISTTEKIKMLSMLSSVGATKKQIRKSVTKEGFYLGLIGIPLGILLGIFAVFVLILIVNFLLKDFIIDGSNFSFDMPLIVVLISIILGMITIYLSSLSSSIKASKVSPIEGLRNTNEIKIKNKKLKTPKFINKLFGIGGVIAYKNLKRSRKKYRTTVISLVVSIFIFISMNSFIHYGFNLTKSMFSNIDYNIIVQNGKNYDDIVKFNNINEYTIHYILEEELKIDCSHYTKFSKEYGYVCDDYNITSVYAVNSDAFKRYAKEIGLNPDSIKDQAILFNYGSVNKNGKKITKKLLDYKDGDIVKSDNLSFKIAKTTDKTITGFEMIDFGEYFVVNIDYYRNLNFKANELYIKSSDPYKLADDIKNKYEDLYVSNIEEVAKAQNAFILIVSIFLYGFIGVITLIGVTNIFNTITSNIELRQKEFATLKSIGMTKKEFNKMINLETLFYSLKSLFYGIVLGLIGSYLIYSVFAKKENYSFDIPYIPILLSVIFVFFLVFVIMKFSVKKVNKQNIIETIRKENI